MYQEIKIITADGPYVGMAGTSLYDPNSARIDKCPVAYVPLDGEDQLSQREAAKKFAKYVGRVVDGVERYYYVENVPARIASDGPEPGDE